MSLRTRSHSRRGKRANRVPLLFAGAFFGIFAIIFFVVLGQELKTAAGALKWSATPCSLVTANIIREKAGDRYPPYRLQASFRYQFGGENHTSNSPGLKPLRYSDYSDALRLLHQWQRSSSLSCYVDPANPSQAILVQPSILIPALALIFPVVFFAIGAGLFMLGWKQPKELPAPTAVKAGRFAGETIFAFIFLIGAGVFIPTFVLPGYKMIQARSWNEIPCTVEQSNLRTHYQNKGGRTYSVDILYAYEINGQPYKANRYDFFKGSSSGTASKRKILARYPPGAKTLCWVNPGDPYDTVLNRNPNALALIALVPVLFMSVGVVGIVMVRRRKINHKSRAAMPSVPQSIPNSASGMVVLKPVSTPLRRFLLGLILAIFWNAISTPLFLSWLRGYQRGGQSLPPGLFLALIVAIGAVLAGAAIYAFLQLFSPQPVLRLGKPVIAPGEPVTLTWEFPEGERVRSLEIFLAAQEKVKSRDGKSTFTKKLDRIPLVEESHPLHVHSGAVQMTIPQMIEATPEGRGPVEWIVRLRAKGRGVVGVREDYKLRVA